MLTVQRLQNWNKKMNNSESFLLLLKNLLKCTYEVLLPSQRNAGTKRPVVNQISPVAQAIEIAKTETELERKKKGGFQA